MDIILSLRFNMKSLAWYSFGALLYSFKIWLYKIHGASIRTDNRVCTGCLFISFHFPSHRGSLDLMRFVTVVIVLFSPPLCIDLGSLSLE
jgi:hypothetical protein